MAWYDSVLSKRAHRDYMEIRELGKKIWSYIGNLFTIKELVTFEVWGICVVGIMNSMEPFHVMVSIFIVVLLALLIFKKSSPRITEIPVKDKVDSDSTSIGFTPLEDRISFTDFIRNAGKNGLDLNDVDAIIGFFKALRQAAHNEGLEIFGREKTQFDPILILIPKAHWNDYDIEFIDIFVGYEGTDTGIADNNITVTSKYCGKAIVNSEHTKYIDLHLNSIQAHIVLTKYLSNIKQVSP